MSIMLYDHITNIYSIVLTVVGLVIAMFRYVEHPCRAWIYMIIFLLGNLLSNYYWGAYVLLMTEYPNISSFIAYLGWNIGFAALALLLLNLRSEAEKHFFSPLCLIPIPLNIWQFIIYIPFGGILNNVWQGFWCTLTIVLSINSIVFYLKNRKNGAKKPYVAIVLFFYVILEYIMWTSSCYDWPSLWLYPYTYASLLWIAACVILPWALIRDLQEDENTNRGAALSPIYSVIRPLYVALVLICCVGGYLLAAWIQNVLRASVAVSGDTDPFSIIAVVLFIISLVLVVFSIIIILVVRFGQKAAESDELRTAKTIAEHSNEAKSTFLANMSHEIRTPINAVLGMNEMVLRESIEARDSLPEAREVIRGKFIDIISYAGNIKSAGNSLLSIVNDILDLSKIEAGKFEIVESPYRLSTVLNDVSNMIAFKAKDKGLTFRIDVEENLPDVLYGDEVRVRQIFTNLLNNAVKYTKEGEIHLSVLSGRAEQTDEEKKILLTAKVTDTGIGIKPEDLDKLFEKFQRVDLEQNSDIEGTGLGLAITKNLLDMMGGNIEVESVYGEGSAFTVCLPQQVVSAEPVGNFKDKFDRSMQDTKAYKESFRAPGARILIVDDARMNLTVAAGLLKKTQIMIDMAVSGAEAIRLAKKNHYDLILMDQRMPEMNGTEAMRRILAEEDFDKNTPFICLTADAVSGSRERYIAEGFTDYLTKPIDSKALENMLRKYLPADKVMVTQEKEAGQNDVLKEEDGRAVGFDLLRTAGVDPDTGLLYSQEDRELYCLLLREYAGKADKYQRELESCYEKEDWKNYAILVHTLKSTSKMIGAQALSEQAAKLEAAANENDGKQIHEDHKAMMLHYQSVVDAVRIAVPSSTEISADEEEILDFMPQ